MAEPALGVGLSDPVFRCPDRQITRSGAGQEQGGVYLALGVNLQGEKELLGLWIADTEGAKFWLAVFTELKNRGVQEELCSKVVDEGLR